MKPCSRVILMALLVTAASGPARAANEVYRCIDASGVAEYRNTAAGKECRKVNLPGLTTAPPAKAAKPVATGKAPAASAAPFPKREASARQAGDDDRRLILNHELSAEEKKRAALQAEFNNGEPERRGDERNYAKYQERVQVLKDALARSDSNIEALKRELGGIRQ